MLRRIIIIFVCVIYIVKNSAIFSQSVTIVGFSVNFCIAASEVVEAKNVKRSVAFQCVAVERREKLFSNRPVVSYSLSNVMLKLNYDIRIHYEVTEN
jgi:hypothetical protein